MLVSAVPAAAFGTNCYVVARAAGGPCVVVDPGYGVVDRLAPVLRENDVRPVAVLLTHGHVDHTFSVAPVCDARGVPAYVHPDDDAMLTDPLLGLSPETATMFRAAGLAYRRPREVLPLADDAVLPLAGLQIRVEHAPGHTAGSVLFTLPPDEDDQPAPLCLSGDVLFAGSVGRTDLPGGDPAAMTRTLREKILPMPDDTVVLPGHGPATTIAHERAANPYLRQAAQASG